MGLLGTETEVSQLINCLSISLIFIFSCRRSPPWKELGPEWETLVVTFPVPLGVATVGFAGSSTSSRILSSMSSGDAVDTDDELPPGPNIVTVLTDDCWDWDVG